MISHVPLFRSAWLSVSVISFHKGPSDCCIASKNVFKTLLSLIVAFNAISIVFGVGTVGNKTVQMFGSFGLCIKYIF